MLIKAVKESQSDKECPNKIIVVDSGALVTLLASAIAATTSENILTLEGNPHNLSISYLNGVMGSSWCILNRASEKEDALQLFEEYAVELTAIKLIQLHAVLKGLNTQQNITLKLFDKVLEVRLIQDDSSELILHLKPEG